MQVDIMQPEKQESQASTCRYCGSIHLPQRCPSYVKRCWVCQDEPHNCSMQKHEHEKQTVHTVGQEIDEYPEEYSQIDNVNINFINYDTKSQTL